MERKIFRMYDIRGRYPNEVNEDIAYAIGRYFGSLCKGKKIITGFDGRTSSYELSAALLCGIIDGGSLPISLGLVPTPMVYFADKILSPAAAIMITGSHNPKEDNGLKITLAGKPFFGDQITELYNYISDADFEYAPKEYEVEAIDLSEIYIKRILQDIHINPKLKIVWDTGDGASCNIVNELTKHLRNKNVLINDEIDGNFPSRGPDPTTKENINHLAMLVEEEDFDLAIAFDGDADRVVFLTKSGQLLSGDAVLAIFAEDMLYLHPEATIIADVKCSKAVVDYIKERGGDVVISKTGHCFIKEQMQETGALLAAELSGHIFFADEYYGFDDGIYAAMRMIDLLSRTGDTLDSLYNKIPKLFSTPEVKIEVPDDQKFIIIESIKEHMTKLGRKFTDIDGVRYEDERGWWLIRASNTESYLTTRCEGSTEEALADLREDLESVMDA